MRGPWYTVGEVEAAKAWQTTTDRTGRRAKEAIEGMMYTAGSNTAAYMIQRADYLAATVLRDGPSKPTPLPELDLAFSENARTEGGN